MNQYTESVWVNCKRVFSSAENKHLPELLLKMLNIVRENHMFFERIANKEELDYIVNMDTNDYYIGKNGDNFEVTLRKFTEMNNISKMEMRGIVSRIIWDLSAPVTDTVCPFCRCDHIALFTDFHKEHVYELCQTCLRISENSIQVKWPERLYPATKDVFDKRYRLLFS